MYAERERDLMFMKKLKYSLGFTLAELLIVVAIIAVLVGISIPVFSSQLEKSREAKDLANVRAAYAQVMIAAINEDRNIEYNDEPIYQNGIYSIDVELGQKKVDWDIKDDLIVGGISKSNDFGTKWLHIPLDQDTNICTVFYNPNDNSVILDWTSGKTTIPHEYDFEEGLCFDEVNTTGGKRYIVLSDEPYIDDPTYRHTAIQHMFNPDSNNGISFRTANKKEASKYLDIDNYSYFISVDFVNTANKLSIYGQSAYLSTNESYEAALDWGNDDLRFTTKNSSSTKAMIDLSKKDSSGNYVALLPEEIDYIMSLYTK